MNFSKTIMLCPIFTIACFPSFLDRSEIFPENPFDDYDGDFMTESEGDCNDRNPDITNGPWYLDADGDGYGDPNNFTSDCEEKELGSFVLNDEDCNDSYNSIFPGSARFEPSICAVDSDGDGYGDAAPNVPADVGVDCDDSDGTVYPGNNEEAGVICILDIDDDGYGEMDAPLPYDSGTDCDDSEINSHPLALEICDGIHNDCNGEIDELGSYGAPIWFLDADADGFGDPEISLPSCQQPQGYSNIGTDCDDSVASTFLGAPEYCNEVDDDCDGTVDEADSLDAPQWYQDFDGDGFGNPGFSQPSCVAVSGFVDNSKDCNDLDDAISPAGSEVCDSVDNNCDGSTDEDSAIDALEWYQDSDSDGYGSPYSTTFSCNQPAGYLSNGSDCDDGDPNQNPGASEYCNLDDDDCDGMIDEEAVDSLDFYYDEDLDGYGIPDSSLMVSSCPVGNNYDSPTGYSLTDDDCDDSRADVHPSAFELCDDTIDYNCDGYMILGAIDYVTYYADSDGDGYGNPLYVLDVCNEPLGYIVYNSGDEVDCDDNDFEVRPGLLPSQELCNGKLDRCEDDDGYLTPPQNEHDDDGDGYVECTLDVDPLQWADLSLGIIGGDDCEDDDPTAYPEATEFCNGVFEDCSDPLYSLQDAPDDELDDDGDYFVECIFDAGIWEGDPDVFSNALLDSGGGEDCNDNSPFTYPGAAPNTSPTACLSDFDGDGYADTNWALCPATQTGAEARYQLIGEGHLDRAGNSVSSAGDVDGDGLDDILVGAYGDNDGGYYAGKVHLVLGSSFGSSTTMDLSTADYSFVGENALDYAGRERSVSSAGDVDGDGLDDILVGAYGNDENGDSAGKVYLLLGSSLESTTTMDLSLADYSFIGENALDHAGSSVSSAGDVDGDGLDDILIGATGNDDGGYNAGKAYLVLGSSLGSTSTIDLSTADYSFLGEADYNTAGRLVSSAGDVDGDGLDDILIGAAYASHGAGFGRSGGKAYLLLGSSLGSSTTIDLSNVDHFFGGENEYDFAGWSASGAGDVDGDGLDDILIGAYAADGGGDSAGKSYLILGSSLGSTTTMDLSLADYSFIGENEYDFAGYSVSGAGDVDADGLDDILIGAYGNDENGDSAGKSYLILGSSLGSTTTMDLSLADYSFLGESIDDYFGERISGVGDVDGDGFDDILMGASGNDDGGDRAGKAYIFSACE